MNLNFLCPPHRCSRITSTSPRHFACQPSAQVHKPYSLSSTTTATMWAHKYWHLQHSDSRNTFIYTQMTLCTLPCCDMSLGSLTLHAPEAGDFMELILPHLCKTWQCNELMLGHQLVGSFRWWSFALWHHVELLMDAIVMDEHTASILGV